MVSTLPENWQVARWASSRARAYGDRRTAADLAAPFYLLAGELEGGILAKNVWQVLREAASLARQYGNVHSEVQVFERLALEFESMVGQPARAFHTCERSV